MDLALYPYISDYTTYLCHVLLLLLYVHLSISPTQLLEGRDCVIFFPLSVYIFQSELFKSHRHSDLVFAILYPNGYLHNGLKDLAGCSLPLTSLSLHPLSTSLIPL